MTIVQQSCRAEAEMAAANDCATRVAGALNVAHAQAITMIAEAIESKAWFQAGIRTIEQWLTWQMGLTHSRAKRWVAIARRRHELPVTFAAFEHGELSVDQVSVIVDHVPARHDAQACELAKITLVSQFAPLVRRYPFQPPHTTTETEPAEPARPTPAPARRSLSRWYDDDGSFHLTLHTNGDDGAIIDQALREAHDRLFRDGMHHVTHTDAFVDVCSRSLDAIPSRSRRNRYRAYIHVDTDGAWINQGPRLPDHLVDEILCDGTITPVWTTHGLPINVGPSTPMIPDHLRRIVLDRDRVCRICGSTVGLQLHHIHHLEHGGHTTSGNLLAVCGACHRAHHHGELIISTHPGRDANAHDGIIITRANGATLTPAPPKPPPDGIPPPPPHGHHYQHPIGSRLDHHWIHFHGEPTTS